MFFLVIGAIQIRDDDEFEMMIVT